MQAKSIDNKVKPNFINVGKEESNGIYPSTEYTCMNCDLAAKEIKWEPSPLVLFIII
jgi:hypothetical protein